MPVNHSARETPIATTPNGIRFDTKATTASARITSVVATGLMHATLVAPPQRYSREPVEQAPPRRAAIYDNRGPAATLPGSPIPARPERHDLRRSYGSSSSCGAVFE